MVKHKKIKKSKKKKKPSKKEKSPEEFESTLMYRVLKWLSGRSPNSEFIKKPAE